MSHSKKNLAKCCDKFLLIFIHLNLLLLLSDLINFEYSRQIFKKFSNTKFLNNPSRGSRFVPCGRTDRHDEADRC
jgi:hypothetical protein